MMNASEKYNHALKLRNAISSKKDAEDIIKEESALLCRYVEETGDKTFRWKSGLSLTYVSGSPAKETVDAKQFMDLAKQYMSAADYAACIAQSKKMGGARKASFR